MMKWVYTEDEYGVYGKLMDGEEVVAESTKYKKKWYDENPTQEPEPEPPSDTDILAEELVRMKFENMQKDAVISTFGEEITKLKLDLMILKGGA